MSDIQYLIAEVQARIAEREKEQKAWQVFTDKANQTCGRLEERIAELEKECDQWQESNGQMYVRATEAEMREEKLRDRIAILERRLDMGIGHMTLKESGE